MKSESFVSVVIVIDTDNVTCSEKVTTLHGQLDNAFADFEILLIKQGPWMIGEDPILELLQGHSCIRIIQLSSKLPYEVALGAGLENSIGDFVVLFDPSTDPDTVVPQMVERCRSGIDVVVGTASSRLSLPYRVFRWFAGIVLRSIEYEMPRNATGLRCLSRRAVNAVVMSGRFHHQLYLLIQKTGYPTQGFDYDLVGNASTKRFLGGFKVLLNLVVFNSSRPIRWMSFLGMLGSLIAFFFATYSIFVHLVTDNVVQGWTTTILFISSLMFIQFVMLAFFGEYLGRLLDESRRADYSVVYEKNSKVMLNADRVNVHSDSLENSKNRVQTGRAG